MASLSHEYPNDDSTPVPGSDERTERVRSALLRYLDEGRQVIEYDEDRKGPTGEKQLGGSTAP